MPREEYVPGPLCTDMGVGEPGLPLYLEPTERGIAVARGRELIGHVSADELQAVVDTARERCLRCGKYLDPAAFVNAMVEQTWYELGLALVEEGYERPQMLNDALREKLQRIMRRTFRQQP